MQLKAPFSCKRHIASPARICYAEMYVLNVLDNGALLHVLCAAIPPACQGGVVSPPVPVNATEVQR
jgi:hypothetical protein